MSRRLTYGRFGILAVRDCIMKSCRAGLRRNTELFGEQLPDSCILAQCTCPPAESCEARHHLPVGILTQRIERKRTSCICQRTIVETCSSVECSELEECCQCFIQKAGAPGLKPFLEYRGGRFDSVEKIPAIEVNCPGQRRAVMARNFGAEQLNVRLHELAIQQKIVVRC